MTLEKYDKDLEKVQQKIDKLVEPLERMQEQLKQLQTQKKALEQSRLDLSKELEDKDLGEYIRGMELTTEEVKAILAQYKGGCPIETR